MGWELRARVESGIPDAENAMTHAGLPAACQGAAAAGATLRCRRALFWAGDRTIHTLLSRPHPPLPPTDFAWLEKDLPRKLRHRPLPAEEPMFCE